MTSGTSPLLEIRDAIAEKRTSAQDAVRGALQAAERLNPGVNALVQVFPEEALAQAREIDERIATEGHPGRLAGVPIVLKDNICLSWGKTTCGSRILENYRSPYSATAARRLMDAGAVIIGKANLDEFAMGSGTERSIFGPTMNPWDATRTAGGSSGGSAAAVAAGIVAGALGSDTGGSIRQPAGMCGVVGYKPTYGRVSRYGLVAYASSLDQIGPLARTVADAALLASVICGHDPLDATSLRDPLDLCSKLEEPVNRLVIGVPRQARSQANHAAVNGALERAAKALHGMGAEVVDVDLPLTDHGIAAYYIIALAEASSNLARFDGIRYGRRADIGPDADLMALYCRSRAEGLGHEVQRRIMLGTHVLSAGYSEAYYLTALKVRRLIRGDFDRAFKGSGGPTGSATGGCHAILMPCSPHPAWRLGEKSGDPLGEYLEDVYTVGVNLAGLPAITVPAGLAKGAGTNGRDLPVGVQLIGPSMEDALLLRIARMLERRAEPAWFAPPATAA
ncbi:MAG TPA: Asp-tRNA(Asn)/Glu-tRNA(Gln) amidotransferase subunit GatA [Phycisphaerales bacterium]|jgi:aspartyl-tRNA(Asn)/glutamyl-tRNA(Gln) amidotransferase subunit A|nr:Asp-tRNA(Asn)/Glu-tRNA(Gln) amidotransferase subunit GatA [Phycisphaerales bacterium]